MKLVTPLLHLLVWLMTSPMVLAQQNDTIIPSDELLQNFQQHSLLGLNKDSLLETTPIDSAQLHIRQFDSTSLARYQEDVEFNYDQKEPKNLSVWEAIKRKLLEWFIEMLGTPQGRHNFRYAVYLLVAVVIVFALLKLVNMDITGLFFWGAKPTKSAIKATWLQEDIHAIDFDKEIAKAIHGKSYRVAVRLFYLYTLKQLSDKQLIDWQLDKTNQTYAKEIAHQAPHLLADFNEATYYFEYVWYGEFAVNQEQFEQAQQLYQRFSQKLA